MDLFKAKSRHWCTVSKSANTKDTSRTGTLYEGLNPQSSTSADAHSWEVHGLVAGKPPFTTGGRGSRVRVQRTAANLGQAVLRANTMATGNRPPTRVRLALFNFASSRPRQVRE
jgi:hypothetical protein